MGNATLPASAFNFKNIPSPSDKMSPEDVAAKEVELVKLRNELKARDQRIQELESTIATQKNSKACSIL